MKYLPWAHAFDDAWWCCLERLQCVLDMGPVANFEVYNSTSFLSLHFLSVSPLPGCLSTSWLTPRCNQPLIMLLLPPPLTTLVRMPSLLSWTVPISQNTFFLSYIVFVGYSVCHSNENSYIFLKSKDEHTVELHSQLTSSSYQNKKRYSLKGERFFPDFIVSYNQALPPKLKIS